MSCRQVNQLNKNYYCQQQSVRPVIGILTILRVYVYRLKYQNTEEIENKKSTTVTHTVITQTPSEYYEYVIKTKSPWQPKPNHKHKPSKNRRRKKQNEIKD